MKNDWKEFHQVCQDLAKYSTCHCWNTERERKFARSLAYESLAQMIALVIEHRGLTFVEKILAAKRLDPVWNKLMTDDISSTIRKTNEQILKEILLKTVPPQHFEEVQEAMHNFDLLVSKAA